MRTVKPRIPAGPEPLHSRKLKIEFYDTDGVRHSITIDGPVSREKVGKILDLVEMISGTPLPSPAALRVSSKKLDRLTSTILTRLNTKPFTSSDAKKTFEATFSEKIPLSTVSTYLSRLVDRGLLQKQAQNEGLRYSVMPGLQQPLPGHPSSSPQTPQS